MKIEDQEDRKFDGRHSAEGADAPASTSSTASNCISPNCPAAGSRHSLRTIPTSRRTMDIVDEIIDKYRTCPSRAREVTEPVWLTYELVIAIA